VLGEAAIAALDRLVDATLQSICHNGFLAECTVLAAAERVLVRFWRRRHTPILCWISQTVRPCIARFRRALGEPKNLPQKSHVVLAVSSRIVRAL
jgi:hypothetical protein